MANAADEALSYLTYATPAKWIENDQCEDVRGGLKGGGWLMEAEALLRA